MVTEIIYKLHLLNVHRDSLIVQSLIVFKWFMNSQTLGREESFEILSDYSDSPNEVSGSERKGSQGGIAEVIKLSFSIVHVMTDSFYPLCSSHFNINLTLVFSMTPKNNIWVTLQVLKICRQR